MSQSGQGDYEVTCICGQTMRTPTLYFTCSKCARLIELRWHAEYQPSQNPGSMEERTS